MDRLLKWTTWICFCCLALGLIPGFYAFAQEKGVVPGELIDIQAKRLPDLLRLQLTTTQPVKVRHFTVKKPYQLVLEITPARLAVTQYPTIPEGLISEFRFSQISGTTTRLVLGLPPSATFRVYPQANNPRVWSVDLLIPGKAKAAGKPLPLPALRTPPSPDPETLEAFKQEKETARHQTESGPPPARVSFDFYNADLHNVFRLLGEVGQVNILVGEDVKGKATISLKDLPWDQALDLILDSNKLVKVTDGKNIRIFTLKEYVETENVRRKEGQGVVREQQELLKTEQELLKTEDALQKVQESRLPLLTKTFRLNYVDVASVMKIIEDIWAKDPTKKEKGVASGIKQTNTLFVRANRSDLDHIEKLIKACDQPTAQVMIEARIVEASATFTRDLGLRWGGSYAWANPYAPFAGTVRGGEAGEAGSNYAVNLPLTNPAGAAFGGIGLALAGANFNLDVRLQAMEQEGKGKTISSPKIITLDNKRATIKQGQKVPITTMTSDKNYVTTYIDAALVLAVTPHISTNQKKITLQISVQKNEPNFAEKDTLGNPAIFTKEADTEMTVNNGETVVIGGIIFKQEQLVEDKVPFLGDIPVLGWLFKTQYRNTQDTELLIFLTPKVITTLAERSLPES